MEQSEMIQDVSIINYEDVVEDKVIQELQDSFKLDDNYYVFWWTKNSEFMQTQMIDGSH
jgi:hypothetical protein